MNSSKAWITIVFLFFGVCGAAGAAGQKQVGKFDGAWSVKRCDAREPSKECGVFSLYLVQDGERICGQHFIATPGLSRLDEGEPGTVLGVVDGNKAVLLIRSTRDGARYFAKVELKRGFLDWRVVGKAIESTSEIAPIVPESVRFSRGSSDMDAQQLETVRSAPCEWPDRR